MPHYHVIYKFAVKKKKKRCFAIGWQTEVNRNTCT